MSTFLTVVHIRVINNCHRCAHPGDQQLSPLCPSVGPGWGLFSTLYTPSGEQEGTLFTIVHTPQGSRKERI